MLMEKMQGIILKAERKEEWNALAKAEPFFALLQSWEWGEYKSATGWKVSRVAVEEDGKLVAGAQLLIREIALGLASIAYIPRGPIGKWQDPQVFQVLLASLVEIARAARAAFLRIEPPVRNNRQTADLLYSNGFQATQFTNQPRATILLDLDKASDEVFAAFRKSTRRNIRIAAQKGITVREGGVDDLAMFYQMMKVTGRRGGFRPKSLEYYQKEWEVFSQTGQVVFQVASFQDRPIAAQMAFTFGEHAAFFHQVSSGELAASNPNSLLAWSMIQAVQAQGCRTYDLWGIPDEIAEIPVEVLAMEKPSVLGRRNGLWGVYQFKRGFSKEIVSFLGTYDLVLNPFQYGLATNPVINERTPDKVQAWLDRVLPE